MHQVRTRVQLRKQAAHMDQVVEVIPHYGRSVVEPSHRELCECGEQRAPDDHPFACPKDNYKGGCKPELRLENQAAQSESCRETALRAQCEVGGRKASQR